MVAPPRPMAATIEIAGVAGSGKSTLARLLCADREDCWLDERIRLRKFGHLVRAAHSVPQLVPLLWAGAKERRLPDWAELKLLVYLMEWTRVLGRRQEDRLITTFLDQGPIYALARLGSGDPAPAATEVGGEWWRSRILQWAGSLDVIVWLDAPNDVLWRRLRERSQPHEVREQPEDVAFAYLDQYRESFVSVIDAVVAAGATDLRRYDTSQWSAEQVASDVLQSVDRPRDPLARRLDHD